MVDDIELRDGIIEESERLWETLIGYLHDGSINRRQALKRHHRLRIFLQEYDRRELKLVPPHEMWFAKQVMLSYSELRPKIYA